MVSTTPNPEIFEQIGKERILDPVNCTIDQVKGAERAFELVLPTS